MRTLAAASLRHLTRHPAQLALAFVGLTLGVGTIVAVDIATASAQRAFALSLQAVNGAATHQIVGGPAGLDESLYVELRRHPLLAGQESAPMAPLVSGYVTVGARTLELIGTDPLAAGELGAARRGGGGPPAGAAARAWFTEEGAVFVSDAAAAALHLAPGQAFTVEIDGVRHEAHLAGVLKDAGAGFDNLMLTDIAQAQEWLDAKGHLSRIDLALPPGAAGAAALAALSARLPAGAHVEETRAAARETFAMTDAFTTNLKAMSLLALLVGTFLIYGAVSFAVLQRRNLIGVLRALGATRAEVLRLLLAESAVLGAFGAVCGIVLGALIGRSLVQLVSQTINDLYFVVAVNELALPAATLVKALAAGLLTALLAALVPALEVAGSAPRLGLARSVLEARARSVARAASVLGIALALAAALIVAFSRVSLLAGFAALFLLLLAVAALTPAVLALVARAAARVLGRRSAVMRLALGDVAGSLSRTGVAVAALGMALAAMIGVAVMVESFRESLREWLTRTMRADVYVTAPGPADGLARRLDPALLRSLVALPGVRTHSEVRRALVGSGYGALDLTAVRLVAGGQGAFRLTQGEPGTAWRAFAAGAVLVSEPLAWRLRLKAGDALALVTPDGTHTFRIAGVYREYGNDRGEVLIDLDTYRRLWHDEAVGGVGVYLEPGVAPATAIAALRELSRGRQRLFIRSNAELRAFSMSIFERTFTITRVLYWLAAGVAAIGLLSALLAWELERARTLALLRALGLTPRGTALLILAQTLFMGLVALLAAIPAGLLTALVLTEVINRRAFGWQIDLHLAAPQFTNAL
ncbi:MAG TPA: FtsX-like permease family protein [Steroidobacteraceae bacterium]|nr:FtsX-like permease family protein [Steroidobacteraceae bacterium]